MGSPEERIGRTLGSYRILSVLGSGGMGTVYLGEHLAIGHKAAIKILRRELAEDQEAAQRFFNEARAANLVKHSGIVQIFDFGNEPDVGMYLVMEYLKGENFGEKLRREGALDPEETVRILYRVCSAVGAAHKAGLIHRDLKPDNIFLPSNDEKTGEQRIKVLDFGIAKMLHQAGVQTQSGQMVGTPYYMAPEYIHGNKHFDHRIDIYSLGVIAYEALAGRLPFPGEGIGEVLLAQMTEQPPLMSEINPAVPEELEEVIGHALEKNPDDRFESMEDFGRVLLDAIGEEPTGMRKRRDTTDDAYEPLESAPTQVRPPPMEPTEILTPLPEALGFVAGGPPPAPDGDTALTPGQMMDEETFEKPLPTSETDPQRARSRMATPGEPDPDWSRTETDMMPAHRDPVESEPAAVGPANTLSVTAAEIAIPPRRRLGWPRLVGITLGLLLSVGVISFFAVSGSESSRDVEDYDDEGEDRRAADRDRGDDDDGEASADDGDDDGTEGPRDGVAGTADPVTPATVRIVIDSKPEEAKVFRFPDMVELGLTPYTHAIVPGPGLLHFEVRKEGYLTARVEFPASEDGHRIVVMKRKPLVKKPKKPRPKGGKKGKPSGRPRLELAD